MARPSPRLIGVFVAVGVAAWASAFVVDQVAARFLALPDGAVVAAPGDTVLATTGADGPAPGPEPRRSRVPRKGDLVDPIVSRSIFDSSKVGSTGGGDAPDGPESKSDLDAVLLATVVAEPAEYSSALIARKDGADAKGYGMGDDLFGEGTVVGIEPRRVIIERSDGSREFIAMEVQANIKKSTSRTLREGTKEKEEEGVESVGENKFVVDADLVEEAMKNPEKLASQIRVAPHKDASGNIDGYRLSGIRRNSLFKKLGIKNGDIVHAVNGQPLTSMQSAMGAYESLQNDKNFSFEITRRNQKQTFEYEIR